MIKVKTGTTRFAVRVGSALLCFSTQLSLAGTPTAAPMDATARDAVTRSAQELMRRLPSDLLQSGPTAWLRYFEDSPDFLMAVGGKLQFDGFASAKRFLDDFAKDIPRVELTWTNVRIVPLDATTAAIGAIYDEILTDTQGHSNRPSGYFTGVIVLTPDGWKFSMAHW